MSHGIAPWATEALFPAEESPAEWDPIRGALKEDEDWYRDLVEHSQDLLCVHDLEGRFLSVNPAPARVLGYTVEEMLRKPMRDFVSPQFCAQFDAYLREIERTGESRGLLAVVTRSGERRIWEYHNTLRTEGVARPIVRGGRIASKSPESRAKMSASQKRQRAARRGWLPSSLPAWLTQSSYREMILPKLATIAVPALARTMNVTEYYAAEVRKGRHVPHPMHWQALAELVHVSGETNVEPTVGPIATRLHSTIAVQSES